MHPIPTETFRPAKVEPAAVSIPANRAYGGAVVLAKNLLAGLQDSGDAVPSFSALQIVARHLAESVFSDNQALLFLADRATPDHFWSGHSVNTAILACSMAHTLRWPRDSVETVGWLGLVHDVGLIPYLKDAWEEEPPIHTESTRLCLSKIPDLTPEDLEKAAAVIAQVHEREDGSGYPKHLGGEKIHPFAKVIGLAETYETRTHPRPPRGRMIPHDAVKSLIKPSEGQFDPLILKSAIDTLTLYPPASYVVLNDNSVAQVIRTSPQSLTRPTIRFLLDSEGQWEKEGKVISLAKEPMMVVKEAVDELTIPNIPRELRELLVNQRWWTGAA